MRPDGLTERLSDSGSVAPGAANGTPSFFSLAIHNGGPRGFADEIESMVHLSGLGDYDML